MSIDFKQLREYVVRPVLEHLDPEIPYSLRAENLILGTIAQESHGEYLHQLGRGPALGIIQMEPATHDDIWENFLRYNDSLSERVSALELPEWLGAHGAPELIGNLYYATAMCRVHYWRKPGALPATVEGMANYYKKWYNSFKGAATPKEFIENYRKYVENT